MPDPAPIRFLCVADVPPDPDSGAAGTQVRVVKWLRELGHDVDALWARNLSRRIRHGNLHAVIEQPIAYRAAIRRKWRASLYDVVCVNQPMGYLAARDHRDCGRPGVFIRWSMGLEYSHEKALEEWLPRWGLRKRRGWKALPGAVIDWARRRQERLAARYAFGHVVLCEQDREVLIREFRVPPERVANVHQAPLEEFVDLAPRPLGEDRLKRILTVGQFIPYKAIYHIVETVNRVLPADPSARFTWCCRQEDHGAASALLSEPARAQSAFRGKLDPARFLDLFDEHGVFLFPSIHEGFGKAFLEAMSRGLCVVATSVGGMRDLIVNGQNGFLVEPGDVDGLAARIRELWGNADLARRMSAAARRTAEQYTWRRVASDTADFCRRMLDLRREGG